MLTTVSPRRPAGSLSQGESLRLYDAVRARMDQRRWGVTDRFPNSAPRFYRLRDGAPVQRAKLADFDEAMEWVPGSAAAVADGGKPIALEDAPEELKARPASHLRVVDDTQVLVLPRVTEPPVGVEAVTLRLAALIRAVPGMTGATRAQLEAIADVFLSGEPGSAD